MRKHTKLTKKSLNLDTTTVRVLGEGELIAAAGGAYTKPPVCDTGTQNCSWKWCT